MVESLLIAVDAAPFADRVSGWLPDLLRAGVRRVTLYHAIEREGPGCALELDELRPKLDRLAVQLSAGTVDVELAFKRGDRFRWLVSLVALRGSQLIVLGPRCSLGAAGPNVGSLLGRLLDESPVPLLVVPRARGDDDLPLLDHPFLIEGGTTEPWVDAQARALVPTVLPAGGLSPDGRYPAGASLLVTGRTPTGGRLEELLLDAPCPVLVIPAHADATHA
ncbi:MAG: universal stress protein [Gemmatimonadetes bacterium]|nr:universal stress protein [Gemmatimonadota bacterium]